MCSRLTLQSDISDACIAISSLNPDMGFMTVQQPVFLKLAATLKSHSDLSVPRKKCQDRRNSGICLAVHFVGLPMAR